MCTTSEDVRVGSCLQGRELCECGELTIPRAIVVQQSSARPSKWGQVQTRQIETVLTMQSFSTPLTIYIPETPLPIHSLLGRTVLSHFALFMEERTDRVLLLEPSEADALDLPLNVKS